MTVVVIEGFDYYKTALASPTGDSVAGSWTPLNGTFTSLVAGRFTGQALNADLLAWLRPIPQGTSFSAGVAIFHVRRITAGAAIALCDFNNGVQLGVDISTAGVVTLLRGSTVIGTSPAASIPLNTWVYLEIEATIASSGGTAKVYVNSQKVIDFTGNTQATANAGASLFGLCANSGGGAGHTCYFDDIYVTDTATKLGEMRVETLFPLSDEGTNQWTPSTGTSHFAMVDEVLSDLDTTYLDTTTSGVKELFGMTDYVDVPFQIKAIEVVASVRKTDAGTRSVKAKVKAASTEGNGPEVFLTNTYSYVRGLFGLNPATGTAWTNTSVNAVSAGVEVVT